MRMVTWNCAGAFRKKARHIIPFNPHLVVIQECERPEKLVFKDGFQPECTSWFGDPDARKGVGIFGFSGLHIEPAGEIYDPTIRHCIPLRVTGSWNFNLIAIWAMPQAGLPGWSYIGQVCRAMVSYRAFIHERDTLLVGDLNSNAIFDHHHQECSHTKVVEQLAQSGMVSLYHEYFHELHGHESRPTFYLTKKISHPFHLDYCFAPVQWSQRVMALAVGNYDDWRHWSDHCPIFIEFQEYHS